MSEGADLPGFWPASFLPICSDGACSLCASQLPSTVQVLQLKPKLMGFVDFQSVPWVPASQLEDAAHFWGEEGEAALQASLGCHLAAWDHSSLLVRPINCGSVVWPG
jgi:hypothetical protein